MLQAVSAEQEVGDVGEAHEPAWSARDDEFRQGQRIAAHLRRQEHGDWDASIVLVGHAEFEPGISTRDRLQHPRRRHAGRGQAFGIESDAHGRGEVLRAQAHFARTRQRGDDLCDAAPGDVERLEIGPEDIDDERCRIAEMVSSMRSVRKYWLKDKPGCCASVARKASSTACWRPAGGSSATSNSL